MMNGSLKQNKFCYICLLCFYKIRTMRVIEIKRNPSAFGESFYGSTVVATVDELKTLFESTLQGEDCVGSLDDKTQHE